MVPAMEDASYFRFEGDALSTNEYGSERIDSVFDEMEKHSLAVRNVLELKKKIFAMQAVHQQYADKCSENENLKTDLEKVKQQLVGQGRMCAVLKKQVLMVVDGSAVKAMAELKKEKEMKCREFEEAKNSLVVMQGLLTQMKGSLQEAERQQNKVCTTLDVKAELVAELRAKNEQYEKQLENSRKGNVSAQSEKKEKRVAVKRVAVLERQLDRCKLDRDVLTEKVAQSQSQTAFTQERLEMAHAEIKKLRDSMEELRHQLITGSLPFRGRTSEVCRSPASIETSPNLPSSASAVGPLRPVSLDPDANCGKESLLQPSSPTSKGDPPSTSEIPPSLRRSPRSAARSSRTTSNQQHLSPTKSATRSPARPALKGGQKASPRKQRPPISLPVTWCPTRSATTPCIALTCGPSPTNKPKFDADLSLSSSDSVGGQKASPRKQRPTLPVTWCPSRSATTPWVEAKPSLAPVAANEFQFDADLALSSSDSELDDWQGVEAKPSPAPVAANEFQFDADLAVSSSDSELDDWEGHLISPACAVSPLQARQPGPPMSLHEYLPDVSDSDDEDGHPTASGSAVDKDDATTTETCHTSKSLSASSRLSSPQSSPPCKRRRSARPEKMDQSNQQNGSKQSAPSKSLHEYLPDVSDSDDEDGHPTASGSAVDKDDATTTETLHASKLLSASQPSLPCKRRRSARSEKMDQIFAKYRQHQDWSPITSLLSDSSNDEAPTPAM